MLSRANSSAGTRLRRAKSSSSVHHKHDIQNPEVDPRHAGMAAVEAYRRAYEEGDPLHHPQPLSNPPKRRKQLSRRSEGSHFEESRSGNRLGTARAKVPSRSESVKCPNASSRSENGDIPMDLGKTVVTRPRRVVDTDLQLSTEGSLNRSFAPGLAREHRIRKAKSAYHEQSFMDESALNSNTTRRSIPYPDNPYRSAITKVDQDSDAPDHNMSPHGGRCRATPREMQTDEAIKVVAWDAYLQDFHQQKLRGRKSFIAPIRKRLARDVAPQEKIHHDASVPPYNFACESDDVFSSSPAPPSEAVNSLQIEKLRDTRTVSDSLKSKFKRLIGRSRRAPNTLSAQHIEAHHPHFDTRAVVPPLETADMGYSLSLPFQHSSITPGIRKGSSRSGHSSKDAATLKSRVTSWSNSSGNGTSRTSGQGAALCSIDESGMLKQPDPDSRHGSFLARTFRLPLRRSSRADLNRSSDDSQLLYDALRKEIQDPEEHTGTGTQTTINSQTIATETVIKEYFEPRFQGCAQSERGIETFAAPTIRPVQPSNDEEERVALVRNEVPSRSPPEPPLKMTREASWLRNVRLSLPLQANRSKSGESVTSIRRGNHTDDVLPSNAQRASRLGRSQNRWQAALEDTSSFPSRVVRYSMSEENPYRLHSISATPRDECLPVAIRHGRYPDETPPLVMPDTAQARMRTRDDVVSPSVYSRTSEARTATPDSAKPGYGAYITVTGREIKRYSLDSPSKPLKNDSSAIKPSLEWKTWLNTEMGDFGTTSSAKELVLSEPDRKSVALLADSDLCHQFDVLSSSEEALHHPSVEQTHGPVIRAPKTRRPMLSTRRSSIMNDRYPLIETGKDPNGDCSLKSKVNPDIFNRQSSNISKASEVVTAPISLRPRIRERHSAVVLNSAQQRTSLISSNGVCATGGDEQSAKHKTKSALDLRAVYRSTRKSGSNSINIRRRPISTFVQEDHTLRQISQGPYAQQSPFNKENTAPSPGTTPLTMSSRPMLDNEGTRSNIRASARPASGINIRRGIESPGQRLADEFLMKKGITSTTPVTGDGGSSPAFI